MKQSRNKQMIKKLQSFLTPVLVFISRLGVLPANFSPLGSFGFFSQNIFVYFSIIVFFDLFVGGAYKGNYFTYLGFFAYYLFGKLAKNSLNKKLLFLPLSSLTFYLLSNLGVFLYWYPHTLNGLVTCYLLALPFYTRTFLGDITFGYGYLLITKYLESHKHRQSLVPNFSLPRYI